MDTTVPEKKKIAFTRTDAIASVVLGLIMGVLIPFILSRIGKSVPMQNYLVIAFPLASLIGLYIASLMSKVVPVLYQVGKFGIVGFTNFVVDTGVFHVIIALSGSAHSGYLVSVFSIPITTWTIFKILSFIGANAHSFFWNKFWTFEQKEVKTAKREYIGFLVISLGGLLINSGAFSVAFAFRPEGASEALWGTIGVAVGSVIGLLWNFVGYKFLVFKK
ncbi:MAG: GtrA family protein [Candidatus Azambacteria bacterium]|nr:GtrA family protein [Candidatus Azambacteria bacterium]